MFGTKIILQVSSIKIMAGITMQMLVLTLLIFLKKVKLIFGHPVASAGRHCQLKPPEWNVVNCRFRKPVTLNNKFNLNTQYYQIDQSFSRKRFLTTSEQSGPETNWNLVLPRAWSVFQNILRLNTDIRALAVRADCPIRQRCLIRQYIADLDNIKSRTIPQCITIIQIIHFLFLSFER